MKTAVLLVNYNGGPALQRCLEALAASDAAALPVTVVDNASRDGSVAQLRRDHPAVQVVSRRANDGFAVAVNEGLSRLQDAGFEAVLLLNPDTRVAPDFLAPLQAAVARGAAVAGPKLLRPDGRVWCAGGRVHFGLNLANLRGFGQADRGQFDRAEDVGFLPATVWLLPLATLRQVGPLDETFFCYVEDVDYCVRLAAAGLRLAYEPASVVVHEGSAASGGGYTALRKYLNALGSWHLLRKHGTPGRWLRFLTGDVLSFPLALGYGLLQGRPAAAWWKLRGLWDGAWGRRFDARRRARLQPGASS